MKRARPVRCDRCGNALRRLEGAAVVVRSRSGIVLEVSLHHVACTRAKTGEPGTTEITPAPVFVANREHVARLRRLARVMTGASVTRLERRLRQLGQLDASRPAKPEEKPTGLGRSRVGSSRAAGGELRGTP